jgi:hypothetical protein
MARVIWRLDQRSSPELYVGDLLARFREREPDRFDDLQAYGERAGGQLEDALIELLGIAPEEALDALLRWRDSEAAAGVPSAAVRRQLETLRRLLTLAEREFCDAALIAYVKAHHGATLAEMLAKTLTSDAPS